MSNRMQYAESDFHQHTVKLRQMLNDTATHAREEISKITDPRVRALFKTTAEVLSDLGKAFDDFKRKNEPAWRTTSAG